MKRIRGYVSLYIEAAGETEVHAKNLVDQCAQAIAPQVEALARQYFGIVSAELDYEPEWDDDFCEVCGAYLWEHKNDKCPPNSDWPSDEEREGHLDGLDAMAHGEGRAEE